MSQQEQKHLQNPKIIEVLWNAHINGVNIDENYKYWTGIVSLNKEINIQATTNNIQKKIKFPAKQAFKVNIKSMKQIVKRWITENSVFLLDNFEYNCDEKPQVQGEPQTKDPLRIFVYHEENSNDFEQQSVDSPFSS